MLKELISVGGPRRHVVLYADSEVHRSSSGFFEHFIFALELRNVLVMYSNTNLVLFNVSTCSDEPYMLS